MSEANDELTLLLGDTEFRMTRRNTRLYTFFGNLATRNHIFLVTGEETEETIQGTYIFAHSDNFMPLANFMIDHAYPLSLNNLAVEPGDEAAFQRSLEKISEQAGENVPDEIPDWMEGA